VRRYRCHHPDPWEVGSRIALDEDESAHLARVRRVEAGDEVFVVDGRGREALARVAALTKRTVTLEVESLSRQVPPPAHRLGLVISLTKSTDFDDVMRRAVELGATDILPMVSGRCVVREGDKGKSAQRAARWRRLLVEAVKQCESLWLPVLHEVKPIDAVVATVQAAHTVNLVLAERAGEESPLLEELMSGEARARDVFLHVGPEGGWDESDRALHAGIGAIAVSLGPVILRAETAALAALAIASHARLRLDRAAGGTT
jgi:16S rRNA (uracil1498-N3)-methyltransferase